MGFFHAPPTATHHFQTHTTPQHNPQLMTDFTYPENTPRPLLPDQTEDQLNKYLTVELSFPKHIDLTINTGAVSSRTPLHRDDNHIVYLDENRITAVETLPRSLRFTTSVPRYDIGATLYIEDALEIFTELVPDHLDDPVALRLFYSGPDAMETLSNPEFNHIDAPETFFPYTTTSLNNASHYAILTPDDSDPSPLASFL